MMLRVLLAAIIVSSVLFVSTDFLSGQDDVYYFNGLTTEEGLSSDRYCTSPYVDSYGLVWIGSFNGLNCFDGFRVKQYHMDVAAENALWSESATNSLIFEDSNGDLWLTDKVSVVRYNRKQDDFTHFNFVDKKGETIRNSYRWLYVDTLRGELYASAGNLLYGMSIVDPRESSFVDSTYGGGDDKMYLLPNGGKIMLRSFRGGDRLECRFYRDFKPNRKPIILPVPGGGNVEDMMIRDSTSVWVAVGPDLFIVNWNTEKWTKVGTYSNERKVSITRIAKVNETELLLHTSLGELFKFNSQDYSWGRAFMRSKRNEISNFKTPIKEMTIDEHENVWLVTDKDGLLYTSLNLPKFPFANLGSDSGPTEVRGFSQLEPTNYWVLKQTEAILVSNADTIVYPIPVSGSGLGQTTTIFEDSRKRVWVTTLTDLYLLLPGEQKFVAQNFLPPDMYQRPPGYNDVTELANGDLLFATNRYPVLYVKSDLSKSEWWGNRFVRSRILHAGNNEEFIITTYLDSVFLGVFVDESQEFRVDTSFANLPFVTSIRFDKVRKKYWASTQNGLFGIGRNRKGKWEIELITTNIKRRIFNSLEIDLNGLIWISVPGGLAQYNPDTGELLEFGLEDGIQGLEFGLGASILLKNGRLLFGGLNGYNDFLPINGRPSAKLSRPIIRNLVVGNAEGSAEHFSSGVVGSEKLAKHLELPYFRNNISLDLAGGTFDYPPGTNFLYRLNDSEKPRLVGKERRINLQSLALGDYKLLLQTINTDGVKSHEIEALNFTILPPWYRTWWAYTLYALTIASIVFAFFWIRLQGIRKLEKAQLRTALSETRVAETEARAAENETSVLRLQMNPHFIFNSLNAVNAFLWKGNKLEANEYLARFALLMRETLNRSTQTLSRLEDTIYSLENYLGTEQMRLGDKLSYKFEVDETLDTFSVYFPTMMLQPFVENAIWHGISGMEEQGLITIRFQANRDRGVLVAEVEDNGRGRKQAAKRNTGHASKSLGITQRRLDLLNIALSTAAETSTAPAPRRPENSNQDRLPAGTSTNLTAEMQVIDLIQEDGSAGGTLVRLTLPLKYPKTYARDNS